MSRPRSSEIPRQTEREFQGAVLELAKVLGWRTAHFRPAQTAHGWRTPVSGDGKGFPDCVLVRERVIYAELKRDRGKLTTEQVAWIEALTAAGAEVYVWTPADWDGLVITLTQRSRSSPARDSHPQEEPR